MEKNQVNIYIGKQGWQKRDVIDGILEILKENNKTICDIKYIIKKGHINYWLSWERLISSEIKIKSYDTLNFIIVGDNWWIDRQYEGQDEDTATWNFRTMPKCPKYGYEQYEAYKRIFK